MNQRLPSTYKDGFLMDHIIKKIIKLEDERLTLEEQLFMCPGFNSMFKIKTRIEEIGAEIERLEQKKMLIIQKGKRKV